MIRLRYFSETLTSHEDPHHKSQKSILGKLEGISRLNWVRIDGNVIFGTIELEDYAFNQLLGDNDTVVMHPSISENTTVKNHLAKKNKGKHQSHYDSLDAYCGLSATDTIVDVITKLIGKGHSFLHPER
jgi:hypothetical protein